MLDINEAQGINTLISNDISAIFFKNTDFALKISNTATVARILNKLFFFDLRLTA